MSLVESPTAGLADFVKWGVRTSAIGAVLTELVENELVDCLTNCRQERTAGRSHHELAINDGNLHLSSLRKRFHVLLHLVGNVPQELEPDFGPFGNKIHAVVSRDHELTSQSAIKFVSIKFYFLVLKDLMEVNTDVRFC